MNGLNASPNQRLLFVRSSKNSWSTTASITAAMSVGPCQHRHDGMTTSSEAAAAVTETIVPVMSSSTAIGDVGKQDEDDDTREEHRRRDESDAIRLFLQQFLPTATTATTTATTFTSPNPIVLLQQLYHDRN